MPKRTPIKPRRTDPTAEATTEQHHPGSPDLRPTNPPPELLASGYAYADVALDTIDVDDQLLRADPNGDDVLELANSITTQGLLQPIGVKAKADGRYQLIWGLRRTLAFHRLNRATIPARIYPHAAPPVKALALLENIQRKDLTLTEECDAVAHLHHTELRSPNAIADLLGKTRSWVIRRLTIPSLPTELRTPVLDGRLAVSSAEEMARISDPGARAYVLQQALAHSLNINQVRALRETWEATPTLQPSIDAAVAAANALPHPTTVRLDCAVCASPELPHNLRLIRCCARCFDAILHAAATTTTTDQGGTTDGSPTGSAPH